LAVRGCPNTTGFGTLTLTVAGFLFVSVEVRESHAEAFPHACAQTEVEQCSAANRVCSRYCPFFSVDIERRGVGEGLFLPLTAYADVEKVAAAVGSRRLCLGRQGRAAMKSTPGLRCLRVRINVSILDLEQSIFEKNLPALQRGARALR
jgi:hypothetical protein